MDRLRDDVARELARVGEGPANAMPRIVSAWPEAVGRTIARNAWPARLARDGTLHVATNSSSWAFELQHLEGDIVRRLRAIVGSSSPRALRFAVGKLPELGAEDAHERAARTPPEPGPEAVAKAAELTREIADEELRKMVAKAAAQSLARAGSNRSFW
jgi:hypothetical protein